MKLGKNLVLLEGDDNEHLNAHYTTIKKFNKKYHRYISGPDVKYCVIPVSNLENLYFILPIESMPKNFQKISIKYRLTISRDSANKMPREVFSQEICTIIENPHSLFTFMYSIEELDIFNMLFNFTSASVLKNTIVYGIDYYSINDQENVHINTINDIIDALCKFYDMDLSPLYIIPEVAIFEDKTAKVYEYSGVSANIDYTANKLEKDCIISKAMTETIPIHTFVSRGDDFVLNALKRTNCYKGGFIEFGYGVPVYNDDWSDLDSICGFSPDKSNILRFRTLAEFAIHIKMAISILRAIMKLLQLPNVVDIFDSSDMIPYFAYNIKFEPIDGGWKKDDISEFYNTYNDGHYIKDFIFKNEEDIINSDIYSAFMKDVQEYYFPW